MRRSLSLVALGLSLSVLGVSAASAQQPPVPVPEVLTPWVPWVLADAPLYGCTLATAATDSDRTRDPICVWPGELRIEVGEGGATFTLLGSSDRRHAFALPGSERIQPVDVRLDGRPAVVLTEGGQSLVWVDAGEHRIEGRFSWTTPPETLSVPSEVARVLLVEDGVSSVANRGTNGEVWLRARESETLGEDRVTLEVHRRLDDGSPVTLTTRIVVRAAGRARELALGDILPDGAVPIEVTADLPVRLMASGELSLQLRAGEFTVMVTALVANPETTYRRPALELPWPAQEVWVWVPNESFRQVEISGADGIDPARTSLPDDWRSYSAYLVGSESTFTLSTTRRGEPTPPPNELEVSRTAWLDVNGTGYSVQDHVSFQMHSAHRLELSEGTLGRVSLAGSDQLITLATEDGRPGVELRATQSALTAEWRVESGHASLPAVGWSEDAQSSTTTLNLPPGWELIHAGSVDRAPGTWVERWTLLGFFALLLITAAVGRVLGWQAGAVAFVGVGLALHIDEAPRWIWLTLAVFLAVHRALDGRRFERWLRWGYLAVMVAAVVMVVLFAGSEVKNALYPQLAPAQGYASSAGGEVWDLDERESGGSGADSFAPAAVAPSEAPAAEIEFRSEEHSRSRGIDDLLGGSGSSSPSGRMDYGSNSMWLDPSAVVQTGFGVPTWSWSSYTLAFDGPVSREHRIDLMLSPPWLTRLVALLRAVLALALLALVVRLRPQAPSTPSDEGAPNAPESPVSEASPTPATVGAVAAVAVLLMLGASAWATPARAQTPSPELLGELRTRLTQPPPCERCADANRLTIRIEGDTLIAELEVSAAANASYPLPGPSGTWAPSLVTLDGRATNAVVRLPSGFLHARVPEGVHVLRMEGPLAGRDAITLAFGRVPRTLSVSAEGWEVDGLSAETSAPESIQLRRLLVTQPGADAAIRADLPTWLEIERRLDIGVRWTLTSTVRRRSPANAPAVARIPLLPGESVTGFARDGGRWPGVGDARPERHRAELDLHARARGDRVAGRPARRPPLRGVDTGLQRPLALRERGPVRHRERVGHQLGAALPAVAGRDPGADHDAPWGSARAVHHGGPRHAHGSSRCTAVIQHPRAERAHQREHLAAPHRSERHRRARAHRGPGHPAAPARGRRGGHRAPARVPHRGAHVAGEPRLGHGLRDAAHHAGPHRGERRADRGGRRGPLVLVGERLGLGPCRVVLAVPGAGAGAGLRALAAPRPAATPARLGAVAGGAHTDPPGGGALRCGLVLRARVTQDDGRREPRVVRAAAAVHHRVHADDVRADGLGGAGRPVGRPADEHSGAGVLGPAPALLRGPQRGRAAHGHAADATRVGVPRAHVRVGAVAGGVAGEVGALGLGQLQGRRAVPPGGRSPAPSALRPRAPRRWNPSAPHGDARSADELAHHRRARSGVGAVTE
ncbi:MAG: hypothetical protein IPG81_00685 [Sandaracinaceae bacterium]|nr:hypothetical protein [Sandaracinaceae bacterium]